ncbi:MAG: hypothetical protein IPP56_13385 [Bacteroidetes bacterium]|nr:hypothetical protein [Bacteroidota bacterium]MBK9800651.1 hypothetical protein [Bacteroidota bacterium]MBP6414584.1 hypothetical protein [Bacteroidia bacterium]
MKSKRVKIVQDKQITSIEIVPENDTTKTNLLLAWLIVWTICGIIIFSQFFSNMSREEKLLMAVWMAFWAYFEYKIGSTYLWRKNGSEKILISSDTLSYNITISGKTIEKKFSLIAISNLEIYPFGKNNFSESLQSSYWVRGNESVFFTHEGTKIGVGFQLNLDEARQVQQCIQKKLKQHH